MDRERLGLRLEVNLDLNSDENSVGYRVKSLRGTQFRIGQPR
jgi:hypothetical protein